jgi:hypothetical protein
MAATRLLKVDETANALFFISLCINLSHTQAHTLSLSLTLTLSLSPSPSLTLSLPPSLPPLQHTAQKGFWGALGMGDFYYELGVQLVEVCLEQRPRTGGIDSLDEVLSLLQKKRGSKSQVITLEDVER